MQGNKNNLYGGGCILGEILLSIRSIVGWYG